MKMNDAVEIFNNWKWLLSGGVLEVSRVRAHLGTDFSIIRQHVLSDWQANERRVEGVLYELHPRVLLCPINFGHRVRSAGRVRLPTGMTVPELDLCLPNLGKLVRGGAVMLDFVAYEIRDNAIIATENSMTGNGGTIELQSVSMRGIHTLLRYGTDYQR